MKICWQNYRLHQKENELKEPIKYILEYYCIELAFVITSTELPLTISFIYNNQKLIILACPMITMYYRLELVIFPKWLIKIKV